MFTHDSSNEIFQTAARFVNQTDKHIFLTGKAGTGKTTFLKYIREHTYKKTAVAAPTGVAAINAGGVTLHSLFQLPFGPFLPTRSSSVIENATNQNTLFRNMRFSNEKRELIRELELLIIDEVSMVRADMLDAVDTVLRHFRNRQSVPFGGVQVLFIGDLFQLPPVVRNEEWKMLSEYYASPFFFDAQVIQQSPPLYIELKKIYRQSETTFINILNNVRNNCATAGDLEQLHKKYYPGYTAPDNETYITLSTHNAKADEINQSKLSKLQGKLHEFKGEITGEFNENALPVEMNLRLKEGAQIMFIKNDKGEVRRYYNGKIGSVKKIIRDGDGMKIVITFPNEPEEIVLEKEKWSNIRYTYDREKDKLEEDEIGSYSQYPIRLAWAITIHKSQGLTFEKAIIDAGDSFAAGQVYVALSRLTNMEGLILRSRILPQAISTDERVIAFAKSEMKDEEMQQCLQEEQKVFISRSLLQFFDWSKPLVIFNQHFDEYLHRNIPDKDKVVVWFKSLLEKVSEMEKVSAKFRNQLEQLINSEPVNYQIIHERAQAASGYFVNEADKIITELKTHYEEVKIKKRVKKYLKELGSLILIMDRKKHRIKNATQLSEALMKGVENSEMIQFVESQNNIAVETLEDNSSFSKTGTTTKQAKGETQRISLQLYKEGKSIREIATLRNFAVSTIETHLAGFIFTGEIDIHELVPFEKMKIISKAIEETGAETSSPVKEKLGENYSYAEIRSVMNYRKKMEKEKSVSNSA